MAYGRVPVVGVRRVNPSKHTRPIIMMTRLWVPQIGKTDAKEGMQLEVAEWLARHKTVRRRRDPPRYKVEFITIGI